MQKQNSSKIILGSSSIYRNELLGRILDTFQTISPNIDENNYKSLDARKHSQKIALKKANFISKNQKDTVIICADQIGEINNRILIKPINQKNAISQLMSYSNNRASFYTSSVIFDQGTQQYYKYTDKTVIYFDEITRSLAKAYLKKDKPLDCAGSFKVECAGSILFKRIETKDPSALIGLPLIWVCSILKKLGHIIS